MNTRIQLNPLIKQLAAAAAAPLTSSGVSVKEHTIHTHTASDLQAHVDQLNQRLTDLPDEIKSQVLRELGASLRPLLNSLAQDIHSLSLRDDTLEVRRLQVNMKNLDRVLRKQRLLWIDPHVSG